ncbi:putative Zinc finger C2H2-type [Septoria linicola]|nr:putative Zinc finger C2H2-type [Septoria linicola]
MARSPKRYAIIMDEHNWPLEDIPTPRLSLSTSSSGESVDKLMPTTPKMDSISRDSYLLPGFHFSTENDAVDAAEFHRIAAQLLSGEEKVDFEGEEEEEDSQPLPAPQARDHLHCDLGKDLSGRYRCSCGKSYSEALRLSEHIQRCAGVKNFPCHTCDKIFVTSEALRRHIALKHNGDREPCPECGVKFPSTYLPKHLASGLGGCDGTVQAASVPHLHKQSPAEQSPSQTFWTIEGDHSWRKQRAHDSGYVPDENEEVASQTMSFVTRLLQRPVSSTDKVFCDLCGDEFPAQGDALTAHMGQHSIDFSEKRHRCDDCRIFFANEKDLNRHLQAANLTQHCGFTFRHNTNCTGHHPPTYSKSSVANDHSHMQKHLWSWELNQFRSHRVAVATVLAKTLNVAAKPHMSLGDCQRTYTSMLPHFAAANGDSSGADLLADQHESIDVASLNAHFSRIIDDIDAQRALTAAQREFNAMYSSDRPDSGVILQATKITLHRHRRGVSNAPSSKKNHNLAVSPITTTNDDKSISFRKSVLEKTLRKTTSTENNTKATTKPTGHKRYALSASGFALLKQRAELIERPSSAPGQNRTVAASC